jgi:hypothetical protein
LNSQLFKTLLALAWHVVIYNDGECIPVLLIKCIGYK